jgi:hypothetical protein
MTKGFQRLGLLCALLAGCTNQEVGSSESALAEVKVTRDGDRLTVRGRSADNSLVGKVELRIGEFVDVELGDGPLHGRILDVTLNGTTISHHSIGEAAALSLPLASMGEHADFATFLMDPRVSAALGAAGVSFVLSDVQSEEERPYYTCNPNGNSTCAPTGCFQYQPSGIVTQHVCCSGVMLGIDRVCTGTPNGSSACGPTGGSGCAVCWSMSYTWECSINPSTGRLRVDGVWPGSGGGGGSCVQGNGTCYADSECCSTNCINTPGQAGYCDPNYL